MDGRRGLMMAGISESEPQIAHVGDIAYYNDGSIGVVALDDWDASLGTPVGVVVIPSGFAPDGLARIVSLKWASTGSVWGSYTDTSLINRDTFPITDNKSLNNTGYIDSSSTYKGVSIPVDKGSGEQSLADTEAYYNRGSSGFSYAPSPYLGDKPNPAYDTEISGKNNALADYDGKNNTDVLVALGSGYAAANAARSYIVEGAEEIEWYLPAAGELGYLIARFYKINSVFEKLGGDVILGERVGTGIYHIWSSTEPTSSNAIEFITYVYSLAYDENSKQSTFAVRPFAMLDF